jgi:hypothetical protein
MAEVCLYIPVVNLKVNALNFQTKNADWTDGLKDIMHSSMSTTTKSLHE